MTLLRGVPQRARGRAVQVAPIKPKLKPPGTKRLKLKCDILLSTSAFKFNLRRHTEDLKNLVRYMTYCFYSSW